MQAIINSCGRRVTCGKELAGFPVLPSGLEGCVSTASAGLFERGQWVLRGGGEEQRSYRPVDFCTQCSICQIPGLIPRGHIAVRSECRVSRMKSAHLPIDGEDANVLERETDGVDAVQKETKSLVVGRWRDQFSDDNYETHDGRDSEEVCAQGERRGRGRQEHFQLNVSWYTQKTGTIKGVVCGGDAEWISHVSGREQIRYPSYVSDRAQVSLKVAATIFLVFDTKLVEISTQCAAHSCKLNNFAAEKIFQTRAIRPSC